ncbi:hypothetical protein PG987_013354 [Apiospora arundinis]
MSICGHVVRTTRDVLGWEHLGTDRTTRFTQLNNEAASLGQQLFTEFMTGRDGTYIPELQLETYMDTMRAILVTVKDFEEKYQRFNDKEASSSQQAAALKVMLQKAQDETANHEHQANQALTIYQGAVQTVEGCKSQLDQDVAELDKAQKEFEKGIKKWKEEQAQKLFFAIFDFVLAIGLLCVGDPEGVAEVGKAVEKVSEVESDIAKLTTDTLQKLGDCMEALGSMGSAVKDAVDAAGHLSSDSDALLPQRTAFPAPHAINGKTLAQAQAEIIKVGQRYVQAQMDVAMLQKDVARLQELMETFIGDDEKFAEAQVLLFDRRLALRNVLLREMQRVVSAYRYFALKDSSVILDSTKTVDDLELDLATIEVEIQDAEEQYSSDFQPFTFPIDSKNLPSNYHKMMVDGLKGPTHSASFTLIPDAHSNNDSNFSLSTKRQRRSACSGDFASEFVDGSHWRLDGLEATLRGAVPRSAAAAVVDIKISTSGLYGDVQDGNIFNFTGKPESKLFSYEYGRVWQKGQRSRSGGLPAGDAFRAHPVYNLDFGGEKDVLGKD